MSTVSDDGVVSLRLKHILCISYKGSTPNLIGIDCKFISQPFNLLSWCHYNVYKVDIFAPSTYSLLFLCHCGQFSSHPVQLTHSDRSASFLNHHRCVCASPYHQLILNEQANTCRWPRRKTVLCSIFLRKQRHNLLQGMSYPWKYI